MIPAHNNDGFLPEGIHYATWAEFTARFVTTPKRQTIFADALVAIEHLAECGCVALLMAGSFVTAKDAPSDIDFVWNDSGIDFDELNDMFITLQGIETMRRSLRADVFPSYMTEAASDLPFSQFFQLRKDGTGLCGVIHLDLTSMTRSDP